MIYYISDIHFHDIAIFNKCSRPFKDIDEYDRNIIERWNKKVKDEDIIYVLGDIAKEDYFEVIEILKKLKGHKHFIIGNHDFELLNDLKNSDVFESIKYMDLINDQNRSVHICHYPLMDWIGFNKNGYHVYGHIHNKTIKQGESYSKIKKYYANLKAFNCGVDVTNYEPVTLDEMIKLKEINKDEPYIN